MQTLSYGFLLPQTGDKGSPLFAILKSDIQQLNDHNHDGVNSAQIPAYAVSSTTNKALSTGWAAYGGPVGFYRQIIQMAPGYTYDETNMSFRTQSGEYCYPKVEKNNDTSFFVYTNDPTVNLTVLYGG